jgi:hypothetical protein
MTKKYEVEDTAQFSSEILSDYIKAPSTGLWLALGGVVILAIATVLWLLNSNLSLLELLFNVSS